MDKVAQEISSAILKESSALDNVTSDLNLNSLSSVLGYYTQIAWSIPEGQGEYLDRYGDVTRPAYQESDVTLTLTGTLSWYALMESYLPSGYVGPTPEDQTLTYTVTIKAITEAEYNSAKAEVDAALEADDPAVITYADDNPDGGPAECGPDAEPSGRCAGFASFWTTSNADVVEAPKYGTGLAVVHRPAVGESAAECTLTLKLEKYGYSGTTEVQVAVKPMEQTRSTQSRLI